MLALWRDGETYVEIGARYGVTKQAVQSRLSRRAKPSDRSANRRAREERRRAEIAAERARAAETDPPADEPTSVCAIPGCSRPARRRTCGPDHARMWQVARRQLDPDEHLRHRQTQARAILREPEAHPASAVERARALVSEDPPPPNRRWIRQDSAVAEVLERVRR
jgi:hypothetical protein